MHNTKQQFVYTLVVFVLVMAEILMCTIGASVRSCVGIGMVIGLIVLVVVFRLERQSIQCVRLLQDSRNEKTFLLKEMHHRIKNNMQVMMGLLETQSFKIKDPKYKQMFQNHVDRIKAMSYLHQNLHDEKSRERIAMHEYLGSILRNLQLMTSNTIQGRIEQCHLGMQQALNVGLIVNEIVSNAIKYAYDEFNGTIDVTLSRKGEKCVLHIQDFGKGYNPDSLGDDTLGVSMIQDMVAFLDESSMTVNSKFGVSVVVTFARRE